MNSNGMMTLITKENLCIHEMIGLKANVKESLSAPYKGISGTVVDETKNTFVIKRRDGKERHVPKIGSVFQFDLGALGKAVVEGSKIAFRPYDRPKKLRRK